MAASTARRLQTRALFGQNIGVVLSVAELNIAEMQDSRQRTKDEHLDVFGQAHDVHSVLNEKLISRRLEFKEHDENKQIEQAFTVDKAIFTRDALAKAIYARIFDFLIQVGRRAHPSDSRSPFL